MPKKFQSTESELFAAMRTLILETSKKTQLPEKFFEGLLDSDDWSLIIKLHALVELSLNRLVTLAIGNERVREIVMRLDTSDKQRGKMAFVKAFELLPSEARAFISRLSQLRNDLVHDLSHFDFSVGRWVREMKGQDLANFINSLNFDPQGKREFWPSKPNKLKEKFRTLPDSDLKALIIFACFSILYAAIDMEFQNIIDPLEKEGKRVQALIDSYQAGLRHSGLKSDPNN